MGGASPQPLESVLERGDCRVRRAIPQAMYSLWPTGLRRVAGHKSLATCARLQFGGPLQTEHQWHANFVIIFSALRSISYKDRSWMTAVASVPVEGKKKPALERKWLMCLTANQMPEQYFPKPGRDCVIATQEMSLLSTCLWQLTDIVSLFFKWSAGFTFCFGSTITSHLIWRVNKPIRW